MPWPLSQDYNEAVQSPDSSFIDPELRGGQAVTNALGMPMPRSGNFADVYEFIGASGAKWAVKCFTREVPGRQERYHQIDLHLLKVKLPFTVGFQYQPGGIRIHGKWYPILKMQWVEGFLLNEFVRNNLDKPALLEGLGQIWVRMAKRLREADLAHADLQHGNVLLVSGSKASSLAVKLIDYDGMWVLALANMKSGEVGHPAYQHPARLQQGGYSAAVDRLPLLVVACALRCLAVGGKSLWDRYDNGDNMLFREADLKAPHNSALIKELHELSDPQARILVRQLHNSLQRKLEDAPAIDELLPEVKPTTRLPAPVALATAVTAEAPPALATTTASASPLDFAEPDAPMPTRKTAAKGGGIPMWAWLAGGGLAVLGVVGVGIAVVLMLFLAGDRNKDKEIAKGKPVQDPAKTVKKLAKKDAANPTKTKPPSKEVVDPDKDKPPVLVGVWQHKAGKGEAKITLHFNGRINDPDGPDTWTLQGSTLILRWPNNNAPGGAWVDTCTVSEDGRSYQGTNQIGFLIIGKKISDTASP
jgi:hypothetical protein